MLGLQPWSQIKQIMSQTKATTTQLEAATSPPSTLAKEVPHPIIEMGHTDLMPFNF